MLLIVPVLLLSCKKETIYHPPPPPPPVDTTATPVLLKEIIIPHVPSPYYHFEYNAAGKVVFASFASDFKRYDVFYNWDRISEMRNNIIINKDRLQYSYDNEGRVFLINFADSAGSVYQRIFLNYDGRKLFNLKWEHKIAGGFIIERTMAMLYYADGNLEQITDHRLPVNTQVESTVIDRFEGYDDKINVDGFDLLHPGFFEHLFLLPDVQLQKNNPGKLTHTGDGTHYTIDFSYTYDNRNVPLIKTGELLYLNGNTAGQRFTETTMYTYY